MDSRPHPLPRSLTYRLYTRAFLFGTLAHLALPDAHHLSWVIPNALLLAGAIALAWLPFERRRLPWLLCFLGVAVPLVGLGDQLTQSTYMVLIAAAGLLARSTEAFFFAVRLLTMAVYGVAAFHKLNADFFDPSMSCASGGMDLLMRNWSLSDPPASWRPLWPVLFLCTEGALVLLFWVRPRLGVVLAALMHIPLTIIFAPAFAWVMAPGWLAFLTRHELAAALRFIGRYRRRLLLISGTLGTISTCLYFRDHWVPYPVWQLMELCLWLLATCIVTFALVAQRRGWSADRRVWRGVPWQQRRVGVALLLLFLANAMTPYLGLQFHHAGAMLSNLRIDPGCWNHLLMPEQMRLRDPYVRIDQVRVPEDLRAGQRLTEQMERRLWHVADLQDSVARYCVQGADPLSLVLTYDGQRQEIANACDGLPLPDQSPGLFQTNLERQCPQRCVH